MFPCAQHFHGDLACEYAPNAAATAAAVAAHSPLVGIALDGRGVYGAWEGAAALPSLDACGGHSGPVPGTASVKTGNATAGISGLAPSSVYHYHLSGAGPPAPCGLFITGDLRFWPVR